MATEEDAKGSRRLLVRVLTTRSRSLGLFLKAAGEH